MICQQTPSIRILLKFILLKTEGIVINSNRDHLKETV